MAVVAVMNVGCCGLQHGGHKCLHKPRNDDWMHRSDSNRFARRKTRESSFRVAGMSALVNDHCLAWQKATLFTGRRRYHDAFQSLESSLPHPITLVY